MEFIMQQTNLKPLETEMRPVLLALRAAQREEGQQTASGVAALPFITVSRQPGISNNGFARHLAEHLGAASPGWKVWDRELVEKVSADHNIAGEIIEALGPHRQWWLGDFLRGMSSSPAPADELAVYRKVATTIGALAQAGKAILMGRGAAYLTFNMPAGVHVRLVAPMDYRVAQLAAELKISPDSAEKHIEKIEREREQFYRRYWQQEPPSPEIFSIALNVMAGDEKDLAQCVLPLVEAASARVTRRS
jgi:cytidylate kinase